MSDHTLDLLILAAAFACLRAAVALAERWIREKDWE
jgi:hypothetical protein